MSEPLDPIQAQLIAARRNQILDAATDVFAEKGFHRATIKDIAAQAGIADGTIYNYFKNKTDLMLGILNRLNETEDRETHLSEMSEGDFRQFFVVYLRHRMALMRSNMQVFRAVLPELLVNNDLRDQYYTQIIHPSFQLAETYFQAMVDDGKLPPIDVALTIRAVAGTVLGILLLNLMGDSEIESRWDAIPDVLARLIFDSFTSE